MFRFSSPYCHKLYDVHINSHSHYFPVDNHFQQQSRHVMTSPVKALHQSVTKCGQTSDSGSEWNPAL